MNTRYIVWTVLFFVLESEQLFGTKVSVNTDCSNLKTIFADASSEYIKCSINYSRPITFCENCVQEYINVLESYNNMSKFLVNNTPCIDNFVNLDRLGIIDSTLSDSKNLWSRAKCNECFMTDNDIPTKIFSNETKTFNLYNQAFQQCINRTEVENICKYCLNNYTQLYSYYSSISNQNEKIGVCMDIVDLMNTTWIYWGDKCCKFRRHNEYIFIGSTVLVCVVTVLYYVLVQFYAKKHSPTIIEQSRFAKVLNSLSS